MQPFHRDAYYQIQTAFLNTSIVFLTGPKGCGKTSVLLDLARHYGDHAEYVDFSVLSEDERHEKFLQVDWAILHGEDKIYLVDNTDACAYLSPERFFAILEYDVLEPGETYNNDAHNNYYMEDAACRIVPRVVFSGKNPAGLSYCGSHYLHGYHENISMDYLSANEYNRYTGTITNTQADYRKGLRTFYPDITDIVSHLDGCMDYSVEGANNFMLAASGDSCSGLSTEDICAGWCAILLAPDMPNDIEECMKSVLRRHPDVLAEELPIVSGRLMEGLAHFLSMEPGSAVDTLRLFSRWRIASLTDSQRKCVIPSVYGQYRNTDIEKLLRSIVYINIHPLLLELSFHGGWDNLPEDYAKIKYECE